MNKSVKEMRLDEAKAEFWQEVLADDVLAQLVINAVNEQYDSGEVTRENLPDISGEVVLPKENLNEMSLRIKTSRSDSYLDGVVGVSFGTFRYVTVLTRTKDVTQEGVLLVAPDESFAFAASEQLLAIDAAAQAKADAMLSFLRAWQKLKRVIMKGVFYLTKFFP